MKRGWKNALVLVGLLTIFTFINMIFSVQYTGQLQSQDDLAPIERQNLVIYREVAETNHDENSEQSHRGEESSTPPNKDLHVYLVEEHHTVLKYWFGAVDKGLIPKEGNTLVHIDGHSDLATPVNTAFYPAFRRPRTVNEFTAMMQANDVFILGAAMSGLFKKVIWILPNWDETAQVAIEKFICQMGKTTVGDIHSKGTFCTCYKTLKNSLSNCTYIPFNADRRDQQVDIPATDCAIQATFEIIILKESFALDFLSKQFDDKYIVLDIDEDYYGCTLPVQPLVDSGMNVSKILDLDTVLDTIICPDNPDKEMKSDKILYNVLEILKSESACERIVPQYVSCVGLSRRKSAVSFLMNQINTNKLNCNDLYYLLARKLINKLSLLTIPELSLLQNLGFCLSTMILPNNSYSESHFGICHGANVPGMSSVQNHDTDRWEITNRTKTLEHILKTLQPLHNPITTVCRSVRDGYTPRKHVRKIENDILNALNVLGRNTSLHYDKWLLGGKEGWYGRHVNSEN